MNPTQRFIQDNVDTIVCEPSGLTLKQLRESLIQKVHIIDRLYPMHIDDEEKP